MSALSWSEMRTILAIVAAVCIAAVIGYYNGLNARQPKQNGAPHD